MEVRASGPQTIQTLGDKHLGHVSSRCQQTSNSDAGIAVGSISEPRIMFVSFVLAWTELW